MQCAVCLGALATDEDLETCLCLTCRKRKQLEGAQKGEKIFSWKGTLTEALDLSQLNEFVGQDVKIEVYRLNQKQPEETQTAETQKPELQVSSVAESERIPEVTPVEPKKEIPGMVKLAPGVLNKLS